ncbi:hypothetical protein ABT56_18970 [Photobacterium aquae]|uniref:Tyr recombinase domain-containing protein n=2 Tax=Photobacterium aquae TaxID=1195763 RepID=A0A0J1JMX6_9GAMM|nr:hypothetical protein ABT56_18970 [Photobacterium aquae]
MTIIDTVYDKNPVLAKLLYMQALTGLRYSDCSWLRYDDFYDEKGKFVAEFDVIQQKVYHKVLTHLIQKKPETPLHELEAKAKKKARHTIHVMPAMKEIVQEQHEIYPNDEFLFANRHHKSEGLPMNIRSANKILNAVKQELNINFALGTHSFRKWFATALAETQPWYVVKDALGQSSINSTIPYVVSKDADIKNAISDLNMKY